MKTIDKISKYGNYFFAGVLYTIFAVSIGMIVGDRITQHYQQERFAQKKFINLTCYDHKDINYIITGTYEFLK